MVIAGIYIAGAVIAFIWVLNKRVRLAAKWLRVRPLNALEVIVCAIPALIWGALWPIFLPIWAVHQITVRRRLRSITGKAGR